MTVLGIVSNSGEVAVNVDRRDCMRFQRAGHLPRVPIPSETVGDDPRVSASGSLVSKEGGLSVVELEESCSVKCTSKGGELWDRTSRLISEKEAPSSPYDWRAGIGCKGKSVDSDCMVRHCRRCLDSPGIEKGWSGVAFKIKLYRMLRSLGPQLLF